MRAGKVSIEEISETCFRKSLIMRTRPRLSGYAAKCVGEVPEALLTRKVIVMRTRPRLSGCAAKVHNVQWTLVLDGPKRSEDVGEVPEALLTRKVIVMRTRPLFFNPDLNKKFSFYPNKIK